MKKALIWIIVALIVLAAGWFWYQRNQAKAPSDSTINTYGSGTPAPTTSPVTAPNAQTQTNNNPNGPDYTPPGAGGEVVAPDVQVTEVDFDGTKFSPDPVKIKAGDYIFFKNKSTVDFWPAPAANGGYAGFDSLKNIAPGGEFKFQFTKAGSWPYYDYSHPNVKGTVIVSP